MECQRLGRPLCKEAHFNTSLTAPYLACVSSSLAFSSAVEETIATFRWDYEYEIEYEYNF